MVDPHQLQKYPELHYQEMMPTVQEKCFQSQLWTVMLEVIRQHIVPVQHVPLIMRHVMVVPNMEKTTAEWKAH